MAEITSDFGFAISCVPRQSSIALEYQSCSVASIEVAAIDKWQKRGAQSGHGHCVGLDSSLTSKTI